MGGKRVGVRLLVAAARYGSTQCAARRLKQRRIFDDVVLTLAGPGASPSEALETDRHVKEGATRSPKRRKMEREEGRRVSGVEHSCNEARCGQGGCEGREKPANRLVCTRPRWSHSGTKLLQQALTLAPVDQPPPFGQSVFINCPFDEDFAPILQAVAFCVVHLGFHPRLAPENADNAAARLDRIREIVRGSRYGIHDLSRCKATVAGEFARMNMPFELGIDHACRLFGEGELQQKSILILERDRFDYQRVLSDISGWDIHAHAGDFEKAVRHVRNWLVAHAGAANVGAALILGKYIAFQQWYFERELAAGSSEDEIREYPTAILVKAMHEWMDAGQPI
jgi:hypothetical protein